LLDPARPHTHRQNVTFVTPNKLYQASPIISLVPDRSERCTIGTKRCRPPDLVDKDYANPPLAAGTVETGISQFLHVSFRCVHWTTTQNSRWRTLVDLLRSSFPASMMTGPGWLSFASSFASWSLRPWWVCEFGRERSSLKRWALTIGQR
jgi:hypothetical protein